MSVEDTKDSVLVEDIAVLNSQSDITSFIEALENKEYLKNCLNPFDSISEEDVLSNISSFTLWLSSTMESMLLAGKILSVNKCLKHFNALLQAINRIRKILNTVKSKQKTKQSFICTVCNQEIQQYQKGSTWDPLQEHEHIEQQFVTFVNEGTIPWLLKTHSQSILLEMNADEQVNGQASTDIENSVEDDTETNFKFNFKPVYDDEVKNIVYPSNLMEKVFRIDSISDYTIQIEYNTIACCLLCRTNVPMTESNILDHVKGSKHLKLTNNGINIESLNVYHSIWPKLNPIYQWHQIYFLPYDILKMMCKLCNVSVNYDQIESHLKEDRHEKEFRFMCNSKVVEKNAYLMSKQLILYKSFNTVLQQNNPVVNPVENGISESSTSASKPPVNTPATKLKKNAHNIIKSVMNPLSKLVLERLENRFKNALKDFQETSTYIVCKTCGVNVEKNESLIKRHIFSEEHKKSSGFEMKKLKYVCEICSSVYSRAAAWDLHLIQNSHVAKCASMPEARKLKLTEYECLSCNVITFGDDLSLKRHNMNQQFGQKRKKEPKLPEEVKNLFKSESHINSQAEKMFSDACEVIAMEDDVKACCGDLEKALASIYKDCKAYPFGSRVSGLGNKDSDLDVFIDTGGMYTGNKNQAAKIQEQIVMEASKLFRKDRIKFDHVNPVPTARTPIVQVFHNPTKIDCDLSFRHGLSVENTKFLKACLCLQPLTQHLILLLKKWSQYCKLDEHITTYALSMMVIFFLQVQGHLLSVKQLKQLNPDKCLVIDGWETINYISNIETLKDHVLEYNGSIKHLLKGFFKYYFQFDYETMVVCPLLGETIPKSAFLQLPPGLMLPPEMKNYVHKLRTDKEPEYFKAISAICIQDPFDLSHNLTKACHPYVVTKIKQKCELTIKYLDSTN